MASNTIKNGHVRYGGLNKQTAGIEKLPDECIHSIFGCLRSSKDLLALTLVSKRFNTLANRSLRIFWGNFCHRVTRYPSLRVQKLGSSLKHLRLEFNVDENAIEEICKLCPNLEILYIKEVSAQIFISIRQFFRKTLSQLKELEIHELMAMVQTAKSRNDVISSLQYCENLSVLRLGASYYDKVKVTSCFEPFFEVVFPRLREFKINFNHISSIEFFTHFTELNPSIRKLSIVRTDFHPILPALLHLKQIQSLELNTTFRRDIVEAILNLFSDNKQVFHALKDLDINMSHNTNSEDAFCKDDLMLFKCLPKLEKLHFNIFPTVITLYDALKLIRQCPNLTHISVGSFVQYYGPDDGDIYKKFRHALKLHKWYIPKHKYWYRSFGYKVYCIGMINLLDILKDMGIEMNKDLDNPI